MRDVQQLRDRILQPGICTPAELEGCSNKDLREIERRIGHSLPRAYKDVMSVIGRHAGEFKSDIRSFFPDVMTLTEHTRAAMRQHCVDFQKLGYTGPDVELPESAFVFHYHELQFMFFHLNEQDDPPIFAWTGSQLGQFKKHGNSIWDVLEFELHCLEWSLELRPDEPTFGPDGEVAGDPDDDLNLDDDYYHGTVTAVERLDEQMFEQHVTAAVLVKGLHESSFKRSRGRARLAVTDDTQVQRMTNGSLQPAEFQNIAAGDRIAVGAWGEMLATKPVTINPDFITLLET